MPAMPDTLVNVDIETGVVALFAGMGAVGTDRFDFACRLAMHLNTEVAKRLHSCTLNVSGLVVAGVCIMPLQYLLL